MNIRKILCIMLAVLLTAGAAGCAKGDSGTPDYYQIGLEVTALMGEIVNSETYLSMIGGQSYMDGVLEEVKTGDYGTPAAVYSLDPDEIKAYFMGMMFSNEEVKKSWDSLSPALQEQLSARIGVQTLVNYINSQAGTSYIAFAGMAGAILKNDSLTGETPACYLYLFEKGEPVLVSFGYHSASGVFAFIPKEARTSPEALSGALFGIKVTPVE